MIDLLNTFKNLDFECHIEIFESQFKKLIAIILFPHDNSNQ